MLEQRKGLNYEGQNIYARIDVHLKSRTVSIQTETPHHKTFTQFTNVSALVNYQKIGSICFYTIIKNFV
jgi:hypothetical protein